MASLYLLRPLGTAQLVFTSDSRTACCFGSQRRSEQCLSAAFGLQSRLDNRSSTSLLSKSSASSSRADGIILTLDNLSQAVEVDQKVSASQLNGTEPSPVERSSTSMRSGSLSGTIPPVPTGRDSFNASGMAEQKSRLSGAALASSDYLNGDGPQRFSHVHSTGDNNPMQHAQSMHGGPRSELRSNYYEESMNESHIQRFSPKIDEMGQIKSIGIPPSNDFYKPKSGDLVLGVVTDSNDLELTVEIGSRVPAMITMREFQPTIEVGSDSFFKIPLDDDSNKAVEGFVVPPVGQVLLVGDQAAPDGAQPGENVKIGTVFVAEVLNSAFGDSRPLLTCRRLAERLVFLRMEQIMKTGEAIQLEIAQYNDGGLQGSLEGLRAFLPKSELLARPENTAALQDYVGKTLTVSIVKLEHHLSNVIVSEIKPWMSENVLLGSVHDLLVTKLFPYGLQVEILDTRVRGFIHITSITRGFVMSVYTFFTEGDVIRGMVIKGRKPGQLSFSIQALEPPDEDGLVLKQRERVYDEAEETAKLSPEYQLPLEERRIFARPLASTNVTFQDKIANLPWLSLEILRNPS